MTFLFAAFTGVYFDNQLLTESPETKEAVNETLTPREVPTPREVVQIIPTQKEDRKDADLNTHRAEGERLDEVADECEGLRCALQPLPIEAQVVATGRHRYAREETSNSTEEMSNAAEQKKNAAIAISAKHTELGQHEVTDNVITACESKKIEEWISQTTLANNQAAITICDMSKGDDVDDEDPDGEMPEIMGGTLSETLSVSQDSDFQRALRVYMGKGPKYGGVQRISGSSTPSLGSSEESQFQDSVRKLLMLGKVGEKNGGRKRRARST